MAQLASNVDIFSKYRYLKSPAVPGCLKSCGEELLNRVKTGQLRVLPSCWTSLVISANEWRQQNADDLQNFLDDLSSDRSHMAGMVGDYQNMSECFGVPTQKVFAAFWDFLLRCQQSLNIQVSYPTYGWVICGPSYTNPFDSIDEAHYAKEVNNLLDSVGEQGLIKRDMFCYTMKILTELVQNAVDSCRDKPALVSLTRYQIAHHFGPILFDITCERCKGTLSERNKSCDYCSTVCGLLQKPYVADLMDRLLRYFEAEFWDNALTFGQKNVRIVPSEPEKTHTDIVNLFYRRKIPPKPTKPKPSVAQASTAIIPQPAILAPKVAAGSVPQHSSVKPRSTTVAQNLQNTGGVVNETKTTRISTTAPPAPVFVAEDPKADQLKERPRTPVSSTEPSSAKNPWEVPPKKSSTKKTKSRSSRRVTTSSKGSVRSRKRTSIQTTKRSTSAKFSSGRKSSVSKRRHTPKPH